MHKRAQVQFLHTNFLVDKNRLTDLLEGITRSGTTWTIQSYLWKRKPSSLLLLLPDASQIGFRIQPELTVNQLRGHHGGPENVVATPEPRPVQIEGFGSCISLIVWFCYGKHL